MLQPQPSLDLSRVDEHVLVIFCLALFPSAVAMGIYCLFHLGVL